MKYNKHIHKYIRIQSGWKRGPTGKRTKEPYYVYRCVLTGCNHFINADLAEMRDTICNYCDNVFKLFGYMMTLRKPHCGCQFVQSEATPDIMGILKEKTNEG